jgi:ASC-1-like (ASCH) protein
MTTPSFKEASLQEPWFSLIKNGTKTIEGRLSRGLYATFQVGEVIVWKNDSDSSALPFQTLIKRISKYDSFRQMLEQEGIEHVLPTVASIEEGVAVYRRFYSEEQEKEHKVLAIEINVLV